MASQRAPTSIITIQNLDHEVAERLRVRAAKNGRSVENEVSSILTETLAEVPDDALSLAEAIRRRFAPLGGVDLEDHPPVNIGEPPIFGQ